MAFERELDITHGEHNVVNLQGKDSGGVGGRGTNELTLRSAMDTGQIGFVLCHYYSMIYDFKSFRTASLLLQWQRFSSVVKQFSTTCARLYKCKFIVNNANLLSRCILHLIHCVIFFLFVSPAGCGIWH